jgi:predicted nucleic acid-binding protein
MEGVRRNFIDDFQPVLDTLIAKGTWINPATYAEVLKLSQEIQRSRGEEKLP